MEDFRCSRCGTVSEYETTEDATENGWELGDNSDNDLCPVCAGERRDIVQECAVCGHRDRIRNLILVADNNTHETAWACRQHRFSIDNTVEINSFGPHPEPSTGGNAMPRTGHVLRKNLDDEAFQRCVECQNEDEPCPKCLEKQAKIKEKEQLTLWPYDTRVRDYHEYDHCKFKSLKYKNKHEHPFLYYGVEWEMLFNSAANIDTIAKDFILATNGMFVAEFDRSVTNLGNGCEFISRPMSYQKWTDPETLELLKKGLAAIEKYNPCSPQPDGCGIHVHLSRIFFEHNTTKDVNKIKGDIDWIFQLFQPEIEKISDRSYTQYCASKAFRIKNQLKQNSPLDHIKGTLNLSRETQFNESISSNHHDCVVQTNRTIEIRTFRSTTDPIRLITIIEFCRALAHAARNLELTEETTLSQILFAKDSKYLPEYIKKQKVDTTKNFNANLEIEL